MDTKYSNVAKYNNVTKYSNITKYSFSYVWVVEMWVLVEHRVIFLHHNNKYHPCTQHTLTHTRTLSLTHTHTHTPPLRVQGYGKLVEGVLLTMIAGEWEYRGVSIITTVMLKPVHAEPVLVTGVKTGPFSSHWEPYLHI